MTTIQILVRVIKSFTVDPPPPFKPGTRFLFSDDLVLERYDDSTPVRGMPRESRPSSGSPKRTIAFSRSAAISSNTTRRTSSTPLDDTPLQKGQVTARGVFLVGKGYDRLEPPVRFAITGGTGPFNTAHGTITEGVPTDGRRLLDIELWF